MKEYKTKYELEIQLDKLKAENMVLKEALEEIILNSNQNTVAVEIAERTLKEVTK